MTVLETLEEAGRKLYEARAAYMVKTNQGLTKTYNRLKDPSCHDPEIVDLRRLHEAVDRAVLDAYGWTDIEVPPYLANSTEFRDTIIERLYELNASRYADEQIRATKRPRNPTATGSQQGLNFP